MAELWSRRLPHSVRTVDLLGSWDNFQQVYPLQRDRQAGPGHWRGCHSFKNITCDGHSLNPSVSRDGGLKMGGTYWYYYRLDGELEQHDPVEPSTTACPLLPGQQVNVLEVPTQVQQGTGANQCSRQFLDSTVFTLDPKAKYSSPKPSLHRNITPEPDKSLSIAPAQGPLADFHYPYRQSTALPTTSQPLERTLSGNYQGPLTASPKASLLMAIFHKLRGTRSAPSTSKNPVGKGSKSPKTIGRKLGETQYSKAPAPHETFTNLSSSRLRVPVNTQDGPLATAQTDPVAPWTADSSVERSVANQSSLSTAGSCSRKLSAQTAVNSKYSKGNFGDPIAKVIPEAHQLTRGSISSPCDNPLDRCLPEPATARPHAALVDGVQMPQGNATRVEQNCLNALQHAASPLVLPIQSNAPGLEASSDEKAPAANRTGLQRPMRPLSLLFDNRETLSTYYTASPSLGSQSSPHFLSQPESPSVRDFEEAWELGSPARPASLGSNCGNPSLADQVADSASSDILDMPQSPSSGFQGYSIPEPEHASSLTLRKPASARFSPNLELSSSDHLVQSWNDGSVHGPTTTLDELVDDLGYLGKMIV
ncbi:MAG: hypothetical protein Q9188_006337 [Gyalolechia gomerana]